MSKTYAQVLKQIETLQSEAEKLRRKEVEGVIERIREAIEAYGLTANDLGLSDGRAQRRSSYSRKSSKAKGRATTVVKFRDESGNTWGGRGPRPQWLRDALSSGKKLEDFAV